MAQNDLSAVLATARAAVDAASAAALPHFRPGVAVELKADRSPVTAADKASEAAILAVLRERFPADAILTEESGAHAGSSSRRWIVDPLDGTRGFSRFGKFWGPLVAFELDGEIVAGAMAMPALGEVYWAARGQGCWANGERCRVSGVASWGDAVFSLGELHKLLAPPWRDAVLGLATTSASSRCYGDLASCALVITGRADAWVEAGVQTWDLAPLKILVEEAGGRFTDLAGRPTVESGNAVATNGKLHEHVLRAFAGAR